ncbi:MAG: hypothetical protein FVQ82_12370 [Planctomycetes bacterium]|nr:hypothetical protein [Planctomycetota bacterium]
MRFIYFILAVPGLVFFSGCPNPDSRSGGSVAGNGVCIYAADRVDIIGLTSVEANPDSGAGSPAVISAYVSLLDRFDSSIKGPGVFRFELYEYVPRTANPIGKQLFRWPEIDLTDATVNNSYWKGYLRSYKFSLGTKIDLAVPKRYILHVTCFTAGKRIVDIFDLNTRSD